MPCCNNHKRTWVFNNPEQTTASNTLREVAGFVGNLYMSFNNVVSSGYVLTPVIDPLVSVTPSGLTLGVPSYGNDLLTLIIPITVSVAGTFQFIVTINDLVSDTIIRRGSLVVESLTGT